MSTQRERILEVARTLAQPFSPPDLVVACWRKYPDEFGLQGYGSKYPAAHRVYSKLYGSTGVIASGAIVQLAHDRLRVNPAWEASR